MNSVSRPSRPCSRAASARRATSPWFITVARPYPGRSDGNAPKGGLVADQDRRPHRDTGIEVDHVRDRHADAAVRGTRADRSRDTGAVDADPVDDAHPARLERVL